MTASMAQIVYCSDKLHSSLYLEAASTVIIHEL